MMKEPRAGRVKTRLGRDIGMTRAAWWFRHQMRALLRRIEDPRWQVELAVAPDTALCSRALPPNAPRYPQGRGDLGARMARVFRSAPTRSVPRGPLLIIGADIPEIDAATIWRGFEALKGKDAVFGPALDGGFWMVGIRAGAPLPAHLFEGVRWSSGHALADSIATMGDLRIGFADRLRDVDTAADLATLRTDLR